MTARLFSPISLGTLTVPNRIYVPPMCQCRANDGVVAAWHFMHYGKLVSSGAGLVVMEATAVQDNGRITTRCLGLYNEVQERALTQLLKQCRCCCEETKIFIQLSHSGRKGSRQDPALGRRTLTVDEGGFPLVAPSRGQFDESAPVAQELTRAEIQKLIEDFASAAVRAKRAGFDGIQIHAAHGYLIHQFLSPLTNRRTDCYGGSSENRMRFGLEVIRAVRDAVGEMPIMVRASSGDFVAGGWTLDDTVTFLQKARTYGVVAADVSPGGLSLQQCLPNKSVAEQSKTAKKVKNLTGLVTYAVGSITEPLQAEAILNAGDADGIGIGREMIRNPNWGWMAAQSLHALVQMPPPYWAAF